MTDIRISPIGVVHNSILEPVDEDWGKVVSRISVGKSYAPGLRGLNQFSHAIILTYFHRAEFDAEKHLVRRPRGLPSMPDIGIFSQRAKDRPNPIGVTSVSILRVGDDFLEVRGLDAIDGTPVLDIKPYYPQFDLVTQPSIPAWVNELMAGYF